MEKNHSMETKMKQRIYLENSCRGRLYHLITTLIKETKEFLYHTSVGLILWKREKVNNMKNEGW
jgi:hypothetical protein